MFRRDNRPRESHRAARPMSDAVRPSEAAPRIVGGDQDILAEADILGIPWRAILSNEIFAEKILRDSVVNLDGDWPLACLFSLLPNSLLQSWRARERIHALSWEAQVERSRAAAALLRSVFLHLAGKRAPGAPIDYLLANHLGFAYQRVLQLLRISRAAERSKGTRAKRIETVEGRTHCSSSDAAWAVDRADSRSRSHRLDDAMRRAREEGFELPVASSELIAFTRLKRFVQRHPFLRATRKFARSPTLDPVSADDRALPGDGVAGQTGTRLNGHTARDDEVMTSPKPDSPLQNPLSRRSHQNSGFFSQTVNGALRRKFSEQCA